MFIWKDFALNNTRKWISETLGGGGAKNGKIVA